MVDSAAPGGPGAGIPGGAGTPSPPAVEPTAPAPESWPVALYFPDENDRLAREERTLASAAEPRARVAAVVGALLSAPPQPPRVAPFPPGVTLGSVFVAGDGVAYVDLRGGDGAEPPVSGSTVERLRIASLVHSILHNVAEVSRVVLLWNGTQRASLAGHVDTSRPLGIDPTLEP